MSKSMMLWTGFMVTMEPVIRFFCVLLSCFLPSYTITIDGKPYLTRYYILLKDWKFFDIWLHHFHMSDQGDELHCHPFEWSYAFILAVGYSEEKRVPGTSTIIRVERRPGMINRILHGDFHRVDLFGKDGWSIFVRGKRTETWLFWDRHTGVERDWTTNPEATA